jgi:hypothetical protein
MTVVGLTGVYHADGGLAGEARYVIGRLLGRTHCALCEITHSTVRRKSEWDEMVARLGIPFELVHLNEMPSDVAAAVSTHGSPVVLARDTDGDLAVVLLPDQVELGGSVTAFEDALRHALPELR